MGSSTYWYRVEAHSFKQFVKVEDKFDKLEQKLYEKYKDIFDKDMDRLNREWQEVWDKKRKASSVKDEIPVYKVVTPAEFDKWFILMRRTNAFKSMEKLPYLYSGSSMSKVLAQWILNRRRKLLVKSDKSDNYALRPKNEEWRFVLTRSDIKDLMKRLESVCGDNRVDAHKAFPIYKDILFGDVRSRPLYMEEEKNNIPYFAPRLLEMLKFTVQNVLGNLEKKYYADYPLMMEILP